MQLLQVQVQHAFLTHRQELARGDLLHNNRPAVACFTLDGDFESIHGLRLRGEEARATSPLYPTPLPTKKESASPVDNGRSAFRPRLAEKAQPVAMHDPLDRLGLVAALPQHFRH